VQAEQVGYLLRCFITAFWPSASLVGKRRLNFASFIKERINFPVINRYRFDSIAIYKFYDWKI
jgi:hypothetical protein